MHGNTWWSTKVGVKLLSDLITFSIFSSDTPLDFLQSIWVVPLKNLMYFLVGINTKQFWNIPEEKCFAPLRILNLFIRCFVNPFVDIALTFFDNSFNSFLFDVTFFSLLSKSAFFTKLAISCLLAKFAYLSLAVKFSAASFLNSWVVMYLLWSWSQVTLFSDSLIFV